MKGMKVKFLHDDIEGQGTVVSEPYSKMLPLDIKEVGDVRSVEQQASITCVVVLEEGGLYEDGWLYEDIPVEDLRLLHEY